MHPLCGRPMLSYVLDLARDLKIKKIVTVLGHQYTQVRPLIKPGIKIVVQKRLLGTADAVKQGLRPLKNFKGTVLILYGDIPLLRKETVKKVIDYHIKNNLDAVILTAKLEKPGSYGRILRDKYGSVSGIIEEKDADDFQKEIKEINTGIICFDKQKLSGALNKIKINRRKHEYYLTDAIEIFYKKGYLLDSINAADINEALGINTHADLAKANRIMQQRLNEKLMLEGISIVDPDSTFIGYGAKIGRNTKIYPFTVIESGVKIGKRCLVGPFVHLREGTTIEDDVIAGNFVEIVRSRISAKTMMKHFGYLGDSKIGRSVNIGAGTVTANFDGKKKNNTVIEDKAFIGSDTVLVAPVKIGRAAKTGAGTVVPKHKNVPQGAVVVGAPARLLK